MSKTITAVSDLHGHLPENLPGGDFLLVAGDIVPPNHYHHTPAGGKEWLIQTFTIWLNHQKKNYNHIIGIAGNHDFALEKTDVGPRLPWTYLQDSHATIENVKFYGSPWTPYFFNWAFNAPANPLEAEKFLYDHWSHIDTDTDVVLSHGPAHGILDKCRDGYKAGCPHLKSNLYGRVHPQLHVFGHIHEAFGVAHSNGTTAANVSYVNSSYKPNGFAYFQFTVDDTIRKNEKESV